MQFPKKGTPQRFLMRLGHDLWIAISKPLGKLLPFVFK